MLTKMGINVCNGTPGECETQQQQQQRSQSSCTDGALLRFVDDAPALLTAIVLHSYAQIVACKNARCEVHHTDGQGRMYLGDNALCAAPGVSPYKHSRREATGNAALRAVHPLIPLHMRSIEEALAPLELMHGRVFISAVGIALHGSEPILRVIEQIVAPSSVGACVLTDGSVRAPAGSGGIDTTDRTPMGRCDTQSGVTATLRSNGISPCARFVHCVGKYTLLSPYHCPCSAYAYQTVKRRETWFCKHLLALQIVLHLEAVGVRPDNLHIRLVDSTEFNKLVLQYVL